MIDPVSQFKLYKIFSINIFGIDLSITNSTIALISTYLILFLIYKISCYKLTFIPNRMQMAFEMLFGTISDLANSIIGKKSKKFSPFILCIFLFVLISNSIGMLPFGFTSTSHISVTFALAIFVFCVVNVVGFMRHGIGYFAILLPDGTPKLLIPLMVVIELFAYLARPISLSIRLAANMAAGHITLKVLIGFIALTGAFGIGFLGVFPFILLTILTGFEILISVLQAYIFTVLVCIYLDDAINMH